MGFRGASADTVATLSTELAGILAASPASASTIGDDLFSLAQTLRSEGSLRRFATDASIAPAAKSGLVQQVFGAKVDAGALAVLDKAVRSRWTVGRDLADALEHLSVVAAVRSAGPEGERISDELFGVASLVKDNPALRDALSDPARSMEDKGRLLDDLLGGKTLPQTVVLARRSVAGAHRTVAVALEEYQKVAAEVRDQGVATVRVARDLSEGDRQRLADALARQYGRRVHLNLLVDPDVLGGIRVEIGDDVIDGTVSSRLDDARRRLVG
ncbi:F0F1 ATP synthase subunit delta [Nocardioides pantholopis]|uniref:F0F1 ATP synthase subunit delta n=1 Tax=Nocardioides pantholopis TaxID=2483798 RepID=UPI000F0916DC|nr:F0F1 ATP synthase subunit delta [Nocardioides pantholopis]